MERRGVVADQPRDAPRDITENIKALGNDNLARLFAKQWERASVVNVASGVFPARKVRVGALFPNPGTVLSIVQSNYSHTWPERLTLFVEEPKSYLTMSEQQYDQHDQFGYDQYETCVPMRLAGQVRIGRFPNPGTPDCLPIRD